MEMTGAEVVCNILRDEGVKYVFGVPGTTEVPLLDVLARTPDIKYVGAVHEAISMAMADGYARASGKIGVVWVHTTPGTANIIGNLYNAFEAGTPIVVMAGQQDSRLQWRSPLLDSNLLPMVEEYTKARWYLRSGHDLASAVHRAIKEAITPPTGPVFLGIPLDFQTQTQVVQVSAAQIGRLRVLSRAYSESLTRAAQLLAAAELPAIVAGRQVPDDNAIAELADLAEILAAPVYTPFPVPKLIFPNSHSLYFGRVPPVGVVFPGLSSFPDVLLVVGSQLFKQFPYIEGPLIPTTTKVIQLDLDPQGMAKDCLAEVALVASPKAGLGELVTEVKRLMPTGQQRIRERLEQLKQAHSQAKTTLEMDLKKDWNASPMHPSRAVREIARALPPSSVVVDEAVMLSSYVENIMEFSEPGSYFTTIACLGWGLPASLGVALATAKRPIVAIVGDGSALFGLQALWTATKYQIPIIMVILNNHSYAAVKFGFANHSYITSREPINLGCDLGDVDFPKIACAFGIDGQRIEEPTEIGPALKKAIAAGKPALFDLIVDPKDVGLGLPRLT